MTIHAWGRHFFAGTIDLVRRAYAAYLRGLETRRRDVARRLKTKDDSEAQRRGFY